MEYARISDALRDLVIQPRDDVDIDTLLDRYFVPDYRHRNVGRLLDRAGLGRMALGAREGLLRGSITVLDEMKDGDAYAERHRLDLEWRDGTTSNTEVYIIGRHAPDGRLAEINEAHLELNGEGA
jgi:hypothetical protein